MRRGHSKSRWWLDRRHTHVIHGQLGIICSLLIIVFLVRLHWEDGRSVQPLKLYSPGPEGGYYPELVESQVEDGIQIRWSATVEPSNVLPAPRDTPPVERVTERPEAAPAAPSRSHAPVIRPVAIRPLSMQTVDAGPHGRLKLPGQLKFSEVIVPHEERPRLIGGSGALRDKLRYPREARRSRVEGVVVVEFLVDEVGNVVGPRIVKGLGYGCDEVVMRAITEVKFFPGIQNGVPVAVKTSLRVRFEIV